MDYLTVSRLLFGLNFVTEFHDSSHSVCRVKCSMFIPQILFIDSIGVPYWLDSIGSSLTTRST